MQGVEEARSPSTSSAGKSGAAARRRRGTRHPRSREAHMANHDYQALRIAIDRGVAFVTIDNGPINLLDQTLIGDLDRAAASSKPTGREGRSAAKRQPRLLHRPCRHQPDPAIAGDAAAAHRTLGRFRRWWTGSAPCRRRPSPGSRVTAAAAAANSCSPATCVSRPSQGSARAAGGGHRHHPGRRRVGAPAATGRARRALEIILGCGDIGADVAERYGYVNRALPADEIARFVTSLAHRIATFPARRSRWRNRPSPWPTPASRTTSSARR